jgi:hypothetical protein
MVAPSANCDEGPSHAASGSIFNIAAPAQFVSFAFWGWTDVYEVQLESCDPGGNAGTVCADLRGDQGATGGGCTVNTLDQDALAASSEVRGSV